MQTGTTIAAALTRLVRSLNGWSKYEIGRLLYVTAKATKTIDVFHAFECADHRRDCRQCSLVLATAAHVSLNVAEDTRAEEN